MVEYERLKLPQKDLFSPAEVAAILHVCRATVYRWCDSGDLNYMKIRGTIRIFRQSIIRILNEISPEQSL